MAEKIYLFDRVENHENLLPLSFTRPIGNFRLGILTIKEKWEYELGAEISFYPVEYLRERYGDIKDSDEAIIFINSTLLPDKSIIKKIKNLNQDEGLYEGKILMAAKCSLKVFNEGGLKRIDLSQDEIRKIRYVFDIFLLNPEEIENDFDRVTSGKETKDLPEGVRVIGELKDSKGKYRFFIEEDAEIECTSINLKEGRIYVGKKVNVMEGACLRGPLALCDYTEIKMGAKIYGGSTFGPHCKIGGEISNSVIFGYTNKAHDGFLGNAVIGEWCNIGAGVNASNLKNDYSKIRIWNYRTRSFMKTNLQFCGLIMGDHSKIGINCMINTATVVGVGVNIHGSGFPRAFVPSFSEGSPTSGFLPVEREKFQEIADRMMCRRDVEMGDSEKKLYDLIYNISEEFR